MMTTTEIIRRRLINQRLVGTKFRTAQDLVSWMGAMQAQEFAMARWAIGLRTAGLTDAAIQDAFNHGDILRTHVLRPTWHFVAPQDIRWIIALSASRVNAANAYMYRQLELGEAIFKRSHRTVAKALKEHGQLTRTDLQSALKRAGIKAEGHRLSYLMMRAELDGLICSGARKEKQSTYALLDDRAPVTKPLDRDQALAKLADRYFNSRGPATVQDFAWWSGLTLREAHAGVESLGTHFVQEMFDGQSYLFAPALLPKSSEPFATFLMPEYDEYGLSYKNRTALQNPHYKEGSSTKAEKVRNYFVIFGRYYRRHLD